MVQRINVRVSDKANEWLDTRSQEMAISKSALVAFAIESYIKESEVVHTLPELLAALGAQQGQLELGNDRKQE